MPNLITIIALLLLPLLPAKQPLMHEFHLSKCMIEFNPQNQAFEISMHIFIDDLEEALRQEGADQLYICTKKEHRKAEKYVFQYIQDHFKVNADDQLLDYTFVGKEVSDDLAAVWCYLEISTSTLPSKLQISNSLLMEIFDDQKNIISIVAPGQDHGYLLFEKGNSSDTVSFK